jgi:hypothetical protein
VGQWIRVEWHFVYSCKIGRYTEQDHYGISYADIFVSCMFHTFE